MRWVREEGRMLVSLSIDLFVALHGQVREGRSD